MLTRRNALFGLLAAPAIIRTPGLLMPIKPFRTWKDDRWLFSGVEIEFDGLPAPEWLAQTMQAELLKILKRSNFSGVCGARLML